MVDPVAIVGDNVFGGAAPRGDPKASPDVAGALAQVPRPRTGGVRRGTGAGGDQGRPQGGRRSLHHRHLHRAGEYVLRAQISDESGESGGGDQCCWTTAHVKVTVK